MISHFLPVVGPNLYFYISSQKDFGFCAVRNMNKIMNMVYIYTYIHIYIHIFIYIYVYIYIYMIYLVIMILHAYVIYKMYICVHM